MIANEPAVLRAFVGLVLRLSLRSICAHRYPIVIIGDANAGCLSQSNMCLFLPQDFIQTVNGQMNLIKYRLIWLVCCRFSSCLAAAVAASFFAVYCQSCLAFCRLSARPLYTSIEIVVDIMIRSPSLSLLHLSNDCIDANN